MIDGDKSFLLQGITGKQDSLELNYYSSLSSLQRPEAGWLSTLAPRRAASIVLTHE